MATRIRLRRTGKKKRAYYRIVVADSRSPRDGRFIEILGNYDPNSNPPRIEIDEGRTLYWLKNGARPTDTVRSLLSKKGILAMLAEEMPGHAVLKRPPKKSKAVMESRKQAVEEAEVTAEDVDEVVEEVAGDVAEEAPEVVVEEVVEEVAGDVAEEAPEVVVEEVVEEVAGDVAEEAPEEVVEVDEQEGGEAAEEVQKETTEEAPASEKVDDEPGDKTEA